MKQIVGAKVRIIEKIIVTLPADFNVFYKKPMLRRVYVICFLWCLALCFCLEVTAQKQKGKASYYSKRLSGAKTASGARLDNEALVCAHRTMPFGTKLLVVNPANGNKVVVEVVDRGPYVRGRIVDLSYHAARELGILQQGVAHVIVEPYERTVIPFLPDPDDLPEVDFVLPPPDHEIVPIWQRRDSLAAFR